MQKVKRLMTRVKGESEKAGLNPSIQKTKIMAFSPITSWQIEGKSGSSDGFNFLGPQNHHSHKIKRCLLFGRKAVTNLDSVLKSKGITLLTKVHIVKAMVFPVVMYGCESWTIKKTKRQRIDAFKLWCWTRLLRVPWTARRSNQSILKEINPDTHWKDCC